MYMKKPWGVLLPAVLVLSLCACAPSQENSSQPSLKASSQASVSGLQESAYPFETTSLSSEPSSQAEPTLPGGVVKASSGKLRYTTSVLSLSAVFPDEFYVEAADYKPPYGIYLQNDTGTATLLIEAVNDSNMTYRQLKDYLSEQYPEADIRITDKKEVTCQRKMTDKSGKSFVVLQKFHLVRNGYHLAAICCRPSDKTIYYGALLDVAFS